MTITKRNFLMFNKNGLMYIPLSNITDVSAFRFRADGLGVVINLQQYIPQGSIRKATNYLEGVYGEHADLTFLAYIDDTLHETRIGEEKIPVIQGLTTDEKEAVTEATSYPKQDKAPHTHIRYDQIAAGALAGSILCLIVAFQLFWYVITLSLVI